MMLLLALASPTPVLDVQGTPDSQQPPIQVSLNNGGRYTFGDRVRVHVRPAEDGYLLVLRTDIRGWVRVLYPADPSAESFVHGGRDVEIRGPQGREAFQAGLNEGTGTVVAARAHEAFHFDRFVTAGRWNYRALDSARTGADPESTLVDIVQQMAGDVHFDYDVVQYSVTDPGAAATYAGGSDGPAYDYGYPYPYWGYPSPYWSFDPFFYGFYGAAFYSPFFSPFFFSPYCFDCYRGFAYGGRGTGFGRPFPRSSYGTGFRTRAAVAAPALRASSGRRYITQTGSRAAMSSRGTSRVYGGARMSSVGTSRGYGGARMSGGGTARGYGGARMSGGAARGGGGGSGGRSGGGGGGRRGR